MPTNKSISPNTDRQRAAAVIRKHLESASYPNRSLDELPDRTGLEMELIYGVVRQRRLLRWLLRQLSRRNPASNIEAIGLIGLYQLIFLEGCPEYAAVNETVATARALGGAKGASYINAILRRYLREKDALTKKMQQQGVALQLSHPDLLFERWVEHFGIEQTTALCKWNNLAAEVAIKICPQRATLADLRIALTQAGIAFRPHPFAPESFIILEKGGKTAEIPGYSEGAFTIQDPATSVAVEMLDPKPGEIILDACAAPGGKTMLIAEKMNGQGLLVAMDLYRARLSRVEGNAQRLGWNFIKIGEGDARTGVPPELMPDNVLFDRILLDVPCSNTGVIRRRPDVRWHFSEPRLKQLTTIQRDILSRQSTYLKPGGRLVYSTCSLEHEENEELVKSWLAENQNFKLVATRFLFPPETQTDGAYVAVLEKIPH